MGCAQEEPKVSGIGLQALMSGLTAFRFGSTLAVKQKEFRLCHPSAKYEN
jgi:hypothetical protein